MQSGWLLTARGVASLNPA
uniref:Uncharacterized protein n=1 Tax=Anguilla anguilla TaxID=7936 RepID=A0A0E9VUX8_ANGAN